MKKRRWSGGGFPCPDGWCSLSLAVMEPMPVVTLTPASHQSRRHTGSQILKKYTQKPYHPESILLRTALRSWQRKTIYLTKPTGSHVENINWLLYSPTIMFCWERLKAGGEGDDRGWGGFMASLTQWTWVWVNSGGWWWTGKPGMLQTMGSQSRTQLNGWTELNWTDVPLWIALFSSLQNPHSL